MANGKVAVDYHICRVCGDRASGFHYGVFCCEGCKGFFYRSVQAVKRYKFCNNSGACLVLKSSRNSCKFCRMQRCLEVGMSYDAVKMGRCRKSDLQSRKNMLIRVVENPDEITISIYRAFANARKQQPDRQNNTDKLSTIYDQRLLYETYFPSVVIFLTCFAKELAWFNRLPTSDQKVLVKSAILEVIAIQDAGNVDVMGSEVVNHRLNFVSDIDKLNQSGSMGRVLGKTMEISIRISQLSLTSVEVSLLIALCLFCSDREDLDPTVEGLSELEEKILRTLKYQLFMNHTRPRSMLPRLIEILCLLRGLSSMYLRDLLESTMERQEDNKDTNR